MLSADQRSKQEVKTSQFLSLHGNWPRKVKEGEVGGREQEGQSVFGFPPKKCVCARFVDLHSSDMWVRHTPNKRYAQADNRYVYAYSFTREQTATQRTPPKTRGKSKPSKWLSDHVPWQKGQHHISLFRFFFFFCRAWLKLGEATPSPPIAETGGTKLGANPDFTSKTATRGIFKTNTEILLCSSSE